MGIDDMKMLEQKAQQLAAEAEQDKQKPKEKILFVRFVGLFVFFKHFCKVLISFKWKKHDSSDYLSLQERHFP